MKNFLSMLNSMSIGFRSIDIEFETFKKDLIKKKAFTLAEVLITLGIIGIVAAITIPTLMTKFQDIVLKQQFKKVYSVLNQSIRQIAYENEAGVPPCYGGTYFHGGNCLKVDENGDCIKWSAVDSNQNTSSCREFYNEWKKVLKVSHICKENAYENGCIPKYKGIDTIYLASHKDENLSESDANKATNGYPGYRQANILKNNEAWVLQDGTILGYGCSGYPCHRFYVDINGNKGPNKWGYDFFPLKMTGDGNKIFIESGNGTREKGGKTPFQMLQ